MRSVSSKNGVQRTHSCFNQIVRGAFQIEEPDGERWDLALELVAEGEGAIVSLGVLALHRNSGICNRAAPSTYGSAHRGSPIDLQELTRNARSRLAAAN